MENLIREASTNTPGIKCDFIANSVTIEGESRPENVRAFYADIFNWMEKYNSSVESIDGKKTLNLNFKLDYFNSSSLKVFMELIELVKKISASHQGVQYAINWYHHEDDEDILDSGKEIEKMNGVKMNFISYS